MGEEEFFRPEKQWHSDTLKKIHETLNKSWCCHGDFRICLDDLTCDLWMTSHPSFRHRELSLTLFVRVFNFSQAKHVHVRVEP